MLNINHFNCIYCLYINYFRFKKFKLINLKLYINENSLILNYLLLYSL